MENENQEILEGGTEKEAENLTAIEPEIDEQTENQTESKNQKNDQNFLENHRNLANFGVKSKKKFNFKLFLSIIYASVLVASIVVISVFYSIYNSQTKDFNFGFNSPNYIKIHTADKTSSSNNQIFSSNTEQYEKIMELYDKSFQISMLDAILQGKSSSEVKPEEGFQSISQSSLNGTYLEFCYNDVQEVYLNGKKYEANIVGDESYYVIVIEVLNSDMLAEINAYFKYKTNNSNEYSYVRFTSLAAQVDLYNYIENL